MSRQPSSEVACVAIASSKDNLLIVTDHEASNRRLGLAHRPAADCIMADKTQLAAQVPEDLGAHPEGKRSRLGGGRGADRRRRCLSPVWRIGSPIPIGSGSWIQAVTKGTGRVGTFGTSISSHASHQLGSASDSGW